jgi:hypothetical protein
VQKFMLMLAILFGFTVAIHAQDAGTPASPAPEPPTSGSAPGTSSAAAPAQPIAFNHKLHVQTAKMSCNDCHEPRGNGTALAIPQPAKCMRCHASIATDKPDIQRLAEAAKNEDPIRWVRVYRVPSFVTFSHNTHTAAGSTCEECHGPVAERTAITLEKDTSMGSCIGCHQAKGAPATCDTCHAIMSKNGHSPFDVDAAVLAPHHIQPAGKPTTTVQAQHSSSRVRPQLAAIASFLHAPML